MNNHKLQTRHRTAVICIHQNSLLVCWFQDPKTKEGFYVVPGGKIEPEESAKACAERETLEETGYRVQVSDKPEKTTQYEFEWAGEVHQCFTAWFIGTLINPQQKPDLVDDADFNLRTEWMECQQVSDLFEYHDHIQEMVLMLMEKAMMGHNG